MTVWLYQMAAYEWTPEEHREAVWEREIVEWPIGRIRSIETGERPSAGDTIILFFAKSGNPEPGVYGWGIVLNYYEKWGTFRFRPVGPSDYLKMNPLWDVEIEQIVNRIRGKFTQATMWKCDNDDVRRLKEKIRQWAI